MTRITMAGSRSLGKATKRLGAAQDQQRNLGGNAQANRSADRAESAIHVNCGMRPLQSRSMQKLLRSYGLGRSEQRTQVQASHIVGDEARRAQPVIQNF